MCFIKAVITSTEASGSAAACIQSKLRFNRFLAAATVLLLSDRYNHTLLMNVSLFPLNVTVFYLPLVIPTSPRPPPLPPLQGLPPVLPPLPKRPALEKTNGAPTIFNAGMFPYQQALANMQFQQQAAFIPSGKPPVTVVHEGS